MGPGPTYTQKKLEGHIGKGLNALFILSSKCLVSPIQALAQLGAAGGSRGFPGPEVQPSLPALLCNYRINEASL